MRPLLCSWLNTLRSKRGWPLFKGGLWGNTVPVEWESEWVWSVCIPVLLLFFTPEHCSWGEETRASNDECAGCGQSAVSHSCSCQLSSVPAREGSGPKSWSPRGLPVQCSHAYRPGGLVDRGCWQMEIPTDEDYKVYSAILFTEALIILWESKVNEWLWC